MNENAYETGIWGQMGKFEEQQEGVKEETTQWGNNDFSRNCF